MRYAFNPYYSIAILSLALTSHGLVGHAGAADGTIKLGIVAPMTGANSRYGATLRKQ